MKTGRKVLICVLVLLMATGAAFAASPALSVVIMSDTADTSTAFLGDDGKTYVALRDAFESIGYDVAWTVLRKL